MLTDFDWGGGHVGWRALPDGTVVVSCGIFDMNNHESWMLAVHAPNRSEGFKRLRRFGVHGLKTRRNSIPTEGWLSELAIQAQGKVVMEKSRESEWPPKRER